MLIPLQNFIMTSSANFKLYVSYHSYGQYILYPWGYDKVVPPDHADLDVVGKKAAQAIQKTGGTPYKVGASSIVLYPAAGGSDDWAKAVGKIKYSYTIELSDTGRYGFILPASYIIKVAKESLAALRVMASAANAAWYVIWLYDLKHYIFITINNYKPHVWIELRLDMTDSLKLFRSKGCEITRMYIYCN